MTSKISTLQGSVLGPVLFLIYINSITDTLSLQYNIFADDLKMCTIPHSTPETYYHATSMCQSDIHELHVVGSSLGLSMNSSKCAVMHFNRCGTTLPPPQYTLDQTQLSVVTSQKDLGVVVDSKLKFHSHASMTSHKTFCYAQQFVGRLSLWSPCSSHMCRCVL